MSRLISSAEQSFKGTLHRATVWPIAGLMAFALLLLGMVAFLISMMWWTDHTNKVIGQALAAEKQLLDVQTSVRGYFLTEDAKFLDPYNQSRPKVQEAIDTLTKMVADNPNQTAVAEQMKQNAAAWLATVDQALFDAKTTGARPSTRTMQQGKPQFDLLRLDVDSFLATEYALRDRRSANAINIGIGTIGTALVVAIGLGVFQALNTRRGLRDTTARFRDAIDLAERRNEQVKRVVRELDVELKAVAEIQRSLLPLRLPHIPTIRLAASYETSKRAGGDYYDFFRLPADDNVSAAEAKWGVLIADVSGHGTPAAVLMAVTHAIAHGIERPLDTPAGLLSFVNDRLVAGYTTENAAFVTAFFGIYNPTTQTLTYSSAGHNPPRLMRHGTTEFVALDEAQSLPLGVQGGETYIDAEMRLRPGDTLVLYTDGWVEARAEGTELFGVERLDEIFTSADDDSPSALVHHAIARLHDYTGDRPPTDDRTLLVMRVCDERDVCEDESSDAVVTVGETTLMDSVEAAMTGGG